MICPTVDFKNDLYELIQANVINLTNKSIDDIYEYWRKNFDERFPVLNTDIKIVSKKTFISEKQNVPVTSFLLGIDFPIWFDTLNYNDIVDNKKRIMIIGIDPLRNEKSFNNFKADKSQDVIIGTPYALHNLKIRSGHTKHYWGLINKLSTKHFVYLTDIYKVFFYTDISKKERSYVYYRNKHEFEKHIELLEREIELVKPNLILILGAESYRQLFAGRQAPKLTEAVEKNVILYRNYPVLPMVHLSGSTRKKTILNFLAINNVEFDQTKNYGEHYYKIVDNYLNS